MFELIASTAATASHDAPLLSVASIGALFTLTIMEIVLGIDNVVFVAIQVNKLPRDQQKAGRTIGMGLALVLRLGLLFGISWVMGLTTELVTLPEWMRNFLYEAHEGHAPKMGPSGRDLILIAGGLFLLFKASREIFSKVEGEQHEHGAEGGTATFGSTIFQLILLDLVFSLDSVITAVGMANRIEIMIIAMVIAVGTMIAASGFIQRFIDKHPSVSLLALSFLNLIGVMLLLEGLGQEINKGYIYSAMAFSLGVELLNIRYRKKQKPVALRGHSIHLEKPVSLD
jgi:predicted tellurium resistance membrane protein TerC